jgi:hypothetical protein
MLTESKEEERNIHQSTFEVRICVTLLETLTKTNNKQPNCLVNIGVKVMKPRVAILEKVTEHNHGLSD